MRRDQAQTLGLRSVTAASMSATYVNIGAVLEINVTHARVTNDLNGDVTLSLDGGTTDYEIIRAGETIPIPLGASSLSVQGGVQPQVKNSGTSATTGTVYLSLLGAKSSF
jgi:hypothetical protein